MKGYLRDNVLWTLCTNHSLSVWFVNRKGVQWLAADTLFCLLIKVLLLITVLTTQPLTRLFIVYCLLFKDTLGLTEKKATYHIVNAPMMLMKLREKIGLLLIIICCILVRLFLLRFLFNLNFFTINNPHNTSTKHFSTVFNKLLEWLS